MFTSVACIASDRTDQLHSGEGELRWIWTQVHNSLSRKNSFAACGNSARPETHHILSDCTQAQPCSRLVHSSAFHNKHCNIKSLLIINSPLIFALMWIWVWFKRVDCERYCKTAWCLWLEEVGSLPPCGGEEDGDGLLTLPTGSGQCVLCLL